jgi:hypothetical protein
MTNLATTLTDFDPDSPVALYDVHGAAMFAFLYEGEFWMDLLGPGSSISKSSGDGDVTITTTDRFGTTAGTRVSPGRYVLRPRGSDGPYSTLSAEDFEKRVHFVDGPAPMLRAELNRRTAELARLRAALESIAHHLRWGRHLPHRTIFGATSATTQVVEETLGRPLDLSKPKK